MLRSRTWLGAVFLASVTLACGGSSRDDQNDDVPEAGKGGSSGKGGAGSGGTSGSVATSGGAGMSTGGSNSAGRGGSAGASAGKGGSSAGSSSAGAGQGGSAGLTNAGRGGTGGAGMSGTAGSGEGGAVDPGMLEDLEETIDTACAAAETCCSSMGIPMMLDTCASDYAERQDAIPAIMMGHVTLDSAALARCQAAYQSESAQCNLNAIVAACEGVYVGHQGVGEPCIGGYDCDRSTDTMTCLITDTSGENNMGTCQKIPHAKLNETCFSTCRAGEDCSSSTQGIATPEELALCFEDEGLYCQYRESGSVCQELVEEGQTCDPADYDSCGSWGQCNDEKCEAVGDLGDSCGSCFHSFQCIDGRCTDPDWANESTCMGYPPGP